MAFTTERFKNDRRFTTLNDNVLGHLAFAIPALGRLIPKAAFDANQVRYAKEGQSNGLYFSGHSSSVLLENSLGLPKDTISRTYKWPGEFSKLDPIELDKAFAEYSKGAMDYARVKSGDTVRMTPARIRYAETEGAKAFAKVCALNDIMAQLNPDVAEARGEALKARQLPGGFKAELFLAAGMMYRKHPEDIKHFVQETTGLMSKEMREYHRGISERVMDKAERFAPPDLSAGWIMSAAVAKTVAERLVVLESQGIKPKPKLYWAKQNVLTDESKTFVNKLKRALGLKGDSPKPTYVDPMQMEPGYENSPATTPQPIDKDLQNVAQLLGVKTEGFESSAIGAHLRQIRIETPSAEPTPHNTDSFSMS